MESPGARIAVLGGPSIDRGDGMTKPATLPGGRAELVFAYLAVEHGRAVSRDELANALWPGMLPDSWAAALRSVVTEVRRFLEAAGLPAGDLLVGARGGYQLHLGPEMTVDIDQARDDLVAGRASMEQGDAPRAAARSSRAAALAALPFLPNHEGEWVQSIRVQLGAIPTGALELAARAYANARDFRAARGAAEELVRHEPYSEAAYRLLIDVLAQAGDRAGAVRAYEQCRDSLRSELGLELSAETETALERALSATASLATAAPSGPLDPALGRPERDFAAYSVLVVEDHAFQRRTALALLRRLGIGDLQEASDGNAALELLAHVSPPDVIVCDIDMPGMDGVEFIRNVARRGLASAIAIASGLDRHLLHTVRAVGEGYGLQVLGAIEKPVTIRALSELLARYRPPARHGGRDRELQLAHEEILGGLADGRIVARLEPIADLSSGGIGAAELVPGWRMNSRGPVSGASFAAALEEPITIARFCERLVELAATAARELVDQGVAELPLAVSLPYPTLADDTLADTLAATSVNLGLPPPRLALIVRATALRGGSAVALDVLARLRLKGFGLWLDEPDPSTPLERMPLTGVRLGPSLVAAAVADPAATAALQEAVDGARRAGRLAIGTGCIGLAEFELLLDLGASHAQGAFFGKAQDAVGLARLAGAWTPPTFSEGEAR
jgi:DNA-binding SARP family transcriptional activator/EAL domain-containing protein (putative c-di-GMP-specific phosphodiesterase class I)